MSTASTRAAICKKLSDQFDSLLNPAKSARGSIKDQLDAIKAQLANLNWSSDIDLDGAVSDLESWINGLIPSGGGDDTNELLDFLRNCDYLRDFFPNPAGLANSTSGSIFDGIKDLISAIGNLFPEFGVGKLLGLIQDSLMPNIPGGLNITALLQAADKIINCIAGRCGPTYAARVDSMTSELQSLYDDMDLDDDPLSSTYGKLNLDNIYDSAGLLVTNKAKMEKAMGSISGSKDSAVAGVSNLKQSLKNLL